MAGMPQRRAQRERLPSIIKPIIPDDIWRRMTEPEKVIACWGGNLDNIRKLVSIPFEEANLHERNMQVRVHETGLKFVLKMVAHKDRDQGRAEVLEQLKQVLTAAQGTANSTPVFTQGSDADLSAASEPADGTTAAPDAPQSPQSSTKSKA
jgi:hypothetical protein